LFLIAMGALFGGLGLLMIPYGIVVLVRRRRGTSTMVRGIGVVVGHYEGSGSRLVDLGPGRPGLFYPVVQIDGAQFTSPVGSRPPSYEVGQRVYVRHPPGQPAAGEIDMSTLGILHAAPLILGIVFLLLGSGLVVGSILFAGPY
jgi:hypothetical protein